MQYIDLSTWPRRPLYDFFRTLDQPYFSLCANIDITQLKVFLSEHSLAFFPAFLYLVSKTANEIPEFRYRIRKDQVILHDQVHPSFTMDAPDNLFTFCQLEYRSSYKEFALEVEQGKEAARTSPLLSQGDTRDDRIYITSIPWVAFTHFSYSMNISGNDSIPRFSWGKFFPEQDRIKIPLSLQVHHALCDGFHVGIFYTRLQELLDDPAASLM